MKTYSDADFVNKIAQGDEDAFQAFYDKYQRMVYYVAYKTMQSEEDAKDILQETFMQIQKSIGNVRNPQYLQLWINRIVVNKCNMMYRKRNLVLFDTKENGSPFYDLVETDSEHLPEEWMHYQSDKEVLMKMIDTLPASQRLMLTLMYFEQMSIEEISKVCDTPTGTVKSRLSTARATLKKKIELYEEKQGERLDFKATSLGALFTSAFLWESTKLSLSAFSIPMKQTRLTNSLLSSSAGKLILLGVLGSVAVGSLLTLQHAFKNHERIAPQVNHAPLSQPQSYTSPEEEAYFKLVMFANTEIVMQMRSKEDIDKHKPYYELLKQKQGVYWKLFLQTQLDSYFE